MTLCPSQVTSTWICRVLLIEATLSAVHWTKRMQRHLNLAIYRLQATGSEWEPRRAYLTMTTMHPALPHLGHCTVWVAQL